MQLLQNNSGQFSETDGYSSPRDFGDSSQRILEKKIIQLANEHVSCFSVLEHYGISFNNSQINGWTNHIICPFPDHNERTPSFGYNTNQDRFNCFGCRKSGRAVEFKSYMDNRSRLDIAQDILYNLGINENEARFINDDLNEKINLIVLNFSKYIQILIKKYKNNDLIIKQIEKIIYCWDMYILYKLTTALNGSKLKVNEFENRAIKYKEILDSLGET